MEERIKISSIQLHKSVTWKGERRGVMEIRKHWGDYFKGFPNFKPFRLKLMEAETLERVISILDEIQDHYPENQQVVMV